MKHALLVLWLFCSCAMLVAEGEKAKDTPQVTVEKVAASAPAENKSEAQKLFEETVYPLMTPKEKCVKCHKGKEPPKEKKFVYEDASKTYAAMKDYIEGGKLEERKIYKRVIMGDKHKKFKWEKDSDEAKKLIAWICKEKACE